MRLEDVTRALEARDPSLVDMIVSLANQPDPHPEDVPEDAETIHTLKSKLSAWDFQWKSPDERRDIRKEAWSRIEAEDAPVPLSDRLRVWEIIEALTEEKGSFAREALLEVIRRAPIRWGAWRGLKRLFKETEKNGDWELHAALIARIDAEFSTTWSNGGEVTRDTLSYLCRRGWRTLRRRAETFPAAYVTAACAVLREYPEGTNWQRSWVANHIVFHDFEHYGGRAYGTGSFRFWRLPDSMTEHRAFPELWRERPEPLFALLERARSEHVRRFAIEGLKTDFRAELRELPVETLERMFGVESGTVHDFVVWLLENSPRFEQAGFKKLGLHDGVVGLLDSNSAQARRYAANYVQTHARDLPLEDLVRLATNSDEAVREVVYELLLDRDPRRDVGLEAWGQLLGAPYAHDLAVRALNDHFGASELTAEWFRERLLSDSWQVVSFATERFVEVHSAESIGPDYFVAIIEHVDASREAIAFAAERLAELDLSQLDRETVRRLVVHPEVTDWAQRWLDEGRVEPASLGVEYWRALAFEPTWSAWNWSDELAASGTGYYADHGWNEAGTDAAARGYLRDVRNFAPRELGVDWLLEVVSHHDEAARSWARDYMFDVFAPGDFASADDDRPNAGCARLWELATGENASDGPVEIFARTYLLRHHDAVGEELTGEPVDEGRQIPRAFLTFERIGAALLDERSLVRRFALQIARWEMARWSPSLDQIRAFSEAGVADVRGLFAEALLADETSENRRLRIDPASLDPAAIFPFCDSLDRGTRELGMAVIDAHRRFAVPERLFGLTDSPDREVRAFVVKVIWRLYRERGTTDGWEPRELSATYVERTEGRFERGPGVTPRPDEMPATPEALRQFLRRVLFGIPPGRLPKGTKRSANAPRPLSAGREKVFLLQTMRDLALEDEHFAGVLSPLLKEFARTLGKAERGASLVALARIDEQWPTLEALAI